MPTRVALPTVWGTRAPRERPTKASVRRRILVLLSLLTVVGWATPSAAGRTLPFAREGGGPRPLGFDLPELSVPQGYEEVYIVPRRAGQNQVRWYGFEFKEVLLPQLPGAGVRLFYYQSERPAAEVAAAVIRDQYLRLARAFEYVPEREVPYILYGTHHEFQATNVFPISEGVLGATSPADLTLALPFFGDMKQFHHTSTHELVHEFTIQVVKSHGELAGKPSGLGGFPLWFIEGLAEYATYGGLDPDGKPGPESPLGAAGPTLPGLDPETEAWARDLLYQSSPFDYYMIFPFYSDFPRSFVHTYKLGQLRVAFLGSTFGREMILWLLQNAHHMSGMGAGPFGAGGSAISFQDLVELGTGQSPEVIQQMFDDWMKRRYLPVYAEARTRVPALEIVTGLPTEPESVVASPDGKVLLVRGIDRSQGRASLWLMDSSKPNRAQHVVSDSRPGLESLHILSRRTFTVSRDRIAWIGRDGAGDTLTVARLTPRQKGSGDLFEIHDKKRFKLFDVGLIEAGEPTFSPDGSRIAFAGITEEGFKNVYILDPEKGLDDLIRIRDDSHGETGLFWGEDGIYLAIDSTPEGNSNLFLLDPDTGDLTPIVVDNSDKESPLPTAMGLLYASDRDGRWDIHRVEEDGIAYRLTDTATQLRSPAPGPGGSIYAVAIHAGRFRLARITPAEQRRMDPRPALEEGIDPTPTEPPRLGLPEDAPDYEPFHHFGIDMGAIAVGTQSVAVGGISFSDLLRDRILAIRLAVYGDLDFTDAAVAWIDRSRRVTWLAGVFHTFQPKRDRTFDTPAFPNDPDFYLERQFGVTGGLSWPLNRYQRFDTTLSLEGVDRSRFTNKNGTRQREWNEDTGGSEPNVLLTGGFGLDDLRYHPAVGPIAGSSALLQVGVSVLPQRLDEGAGVNGFTEVDLQHFIYLGGRSTIWGRAAGGAAYGGRFSRQFYLSSVDNLRGYHWGDERLLGTHYYVANLELTFPLDWLVQVAILEGLRGVGAVDFGGVSDQVDDLWDARSLDLVAGLDFLAGPLALRLHFGYPIQIGPALPSDGWVTNFALRLRY